MSDKPRAAGAGSRLATWALTFGLLAFAGPALLVFGAPILTRFSLLAPLGLVAGVVAVLAALGAVVLGILSQRRLPRHAPERGQASAGIALGAFFFAGLIVAALIALLGPKLGLL